MAIVATEIAVGKRPSPRKLSRMDDDHNIHFYNIHLAFRITIIREQHFLMVDCSRSFGDRKTDFC